MQVKSKIGWISAAAIVVANMIGTGAFTTLGFQLNYLSNHWAVLLLWVVGGLMALFGAWTYAEIGVRLPRSGGEYHFLSRIYHPALGYLSGWVSLTVGFAAAIALAAMAIGDYLSAFTPWSGTWSAIGAILSVALIHSFSLRHSSSFQNLLTVLKLLLLIGIIAAGFLLPSHGVVPDESISGVFQMLSPAGAVALIFVTYAFSGWNAAAYIVDEIHQPERNLPRALVGGTLVVSLLFLLLQWAFLRQTPVHLLQGRADVGQIAAQFMFGDAGGKIISLLISVLLIASVSAMVWVGSRVTRAMAGEHYSWRFFARDNRSGVPVRAVWLQTCISLFLVITSSFEQVLLYSGFVLQLFTLLTVAGLFKLRYREPAAAWKSPGYPYVQIVFLLFSVWALVYLLIDKPYESLLGLLNLVAGGLSYLWDRRQLRRSHASTPVDNQKKVPEPSQVPGPLKQATL